MARDLTTYLRRLVRDGYSVEHRKSNHVAIRDGTKIVTITGLTPHGGKRGLENLKADIKRHERKRGDEQI